MNKRTLLDSLKLENFRIFGDPTKFNFAPLTFLIGPNNSGKSSLIKALLLLQDNFDAPSNLIQELSFRRETHNLGSFDNTLSLNRRGDIMAFTVPITFWGQEILLKLEFEGSASGISEGMLIRIEFQKLDGETPIFTTTGGEITVNITALQEIIKNLIGAEGSSSPTVEEVYDIHLKPKSYIDSVDEYKNQELLRASFEERISQNKIIILEYFYSTLDKDLTRAKNVEVFKSAKRRLEEIKQTAKISNIGAYYFKWEIIDDEEILINGSLDWDKHEKDILYMSLANIENDIWYYLFYSIGALLKKENNKLIDRFCDLLVDELKKSLQTYAQHIVERFDSIGLLRSKQSRVFSNSSAETLDNLIYQYLKLNLNENSLASIFLKEWSEKFNIRFKNIESDKDTHLNKVNIYKNGKNQSLADLGSGTSQLFSILLFIAVKAHQNNYEYGYKFQVLSIEEPESNLHPKFQSLLAEMLVDAANRFNINFIIETHSDILIKKMQLLTAKKIIQPEDSIIYYFSEDHEVTEINIKSNGTLDKPFGEGFYDESDQLLFDLYRISNSN